jgi:hypothetical protein
MLQQQVLASPLRSKNTTREEFAEYKKGTSRRNFVLDAVRNHKASNMRWLCAVALLDVALLSAFAGWPAIPTLAAGAVPQLTSAVLLPPVVLLLCALLDPDTKHRLVFWRWRDVLPGHRAFSHYASVDPRFDVATLKKKIGRFPTKPQEQNARWYVLYKSVEQRASVEDAHKSFLLFRDMAGMSVLLFGATAIVFPVVGINLPRVFMTVGSLALQFLLAMIACRLSAGRFVRNVFAEHAAQP